MKTLRKMFLINPQTFEKYYTNEESPKSKKKTVKPSTTKNHANPKQKDLSNWMQIFQQMLKDKNSKRRKQENRMNIFKQSDKPNQNENSKYTVTGKTNNQSTSPNSNIQNNKKRSSKENDETLVNSDSETSYESLDESEPSDNSSKTSKNYFTRSQAKAHLNHTGKGYLKWKRF